MIENRVTNTAETAADFPAGALSFVAASVRLRAGRRLAWLHHIWRDAENGNGALPHSALFDDRDAPQAEAAWLAAEPALAELNARLEEIEAYLQEDEVSRLALLQQIFGLDALEVDIVRSCLALSLDPSLAALFASLHDHAARGYASELLVARLFGHGRCLLWSSESALRRWQMIVVEEVGPGAPPQLALDRQLRDWLLGENDLAAPLVDVARLVTPLPPLDGWPVAETAAWLHEMMNVSGHEVCLSIIGPRGSGRRTFAACLAAEMGLPLLGLAWGRTPAHDEAWSRLFVLAQRQAFLDRSALAWLGETPAWPQHISHFPLQFLILEAGDSRPELPHSVQRAITMRALSVTERAQQWRRYVPASAAWPEGQLDALAAHFRVQIGDIAAVARQGIDSPAQAAQFIRNRQRNRLGDLAQPIECPFNWDDLVVDKWLAAALADFLYEARTRALFWEQPPARRLFPRGRGLVGLFSGPPGTGKTMAAQVIAADLGLDLFRVDLSAVVSKYVGETSQNLERIMTRAEQMDIVLLFDEADALFSKRTEVKDAHDRFANTDTNYLLQAIENYGGIAVLATNKKGNLDQAFIRRIRYVLDFPPPDAGLRLRIWRQVMAELAGQETVDRLEKGLALLAQQITLTGAQIKFALLAALFAARRAGEPLALPHLLLGLDRELMKEGRTLNSRERQALLRDGAGDAAH